MHQQIFAIDLHNKKMQRMKTVLLNSLGRK